MLNVAIVVDYGPKFGAGHLSRCHGIIEALLNQNEFLCTVFLSNHVPDSQWLGKVQTHPCIRFSNPGFPERENFDAILCDTYQEDVWKSFEVFQAKKKIAILDNNNRHRCFSHSIFKFLLEDFSRFDADPSMVDQLDSEEKVLRGTLIWNSRLQETLEFRSQKRSNCKRQVILTLGRSEVAQAYVPSLVEVLGDFLDRGDLDDIIIFSNTTWSTTNTKTKRKIQQLPFGDDFSIALRDCSLLICASGTTSIEAFHLGIPSIVINLFSNAKNNVVELETRTQNMIFLDKEHLAHEGHISRTLSLCLSGCAPSFPHTRGAITHEDLQRVIGYIREPA